MLLENAKGVMEYVTTVPRYVRELKKYHHKKCYDMTKEDLKRALTITDVNNQNYLLNKFEEIIFKN